MDPVEPVEVYATLSPSEAEIIRAMLDAEGIEADVAGDMQGGFPGALPEISILVHARDAAKARELIAAHQKTHTSETDEEE
jgi:Putative prokaryotic signal transducing protein